MSNDPTHQFVVSPIVPIEIGGVDFSFTNASLFMVATVASASAFLYFSTANRGLIPGRTQSVAEMAYEFIASMLREGAGTKGMNFFPFVFSLFMFVLTANLLGMFPYFFTVTSQIIVTAALAVLVMSIVLIYGIAKHGSHFFGLFVPSGVPGWLLPFMILIEAVSFLSRPVSLSLRLFGNMLAGHIALKVFGGFVVVLLGSGAVLNYAIAPLPLLLAVALTALEVLVAVLQAYVFAILTCVYLNDALHPGH